MSVSLIITTINSPNSNIKAFSEGCKKKGWDFIIIGDKKTPRNFNISYGDYFNLNDQKKLKYNFSRICPKNNYARKNIGYLISFSKNSSWIIETDDDNCPKTNFFSNKPTLYHKTVGIKNKSWINIYDIFKTRNDLIWPRGLPLDEINKHKIVIDKKKKNRKFYLQQGLAEGNPDVDAIYRLTNKKINIKFKNFGVSLSKSISPFNSQNTIWHKNIFKLMYLPVTCTMRCTDIWRSLIALRLLQINNLEVMFYGTNIFQERNIHNLIGDFNQEIPMYMNSKKIFQTIEKINLKKGIKYFNYNLIKIYKVLIKIKIFEENEIIYLKAWLKDCKIL